MIDLINQESELSAKLTQTVSYMKKAGREYAVAERDYKVALMQKSLKLRDEGMAVTLIDKVVYGYVADERMKRDIAEVMYKTAQESINSIKLQLRLLDAQIAREWGSTE